MKNQKTLEAIQHEMFVLKINKNFVIGGIYEVQPNSSTHYYTKDGYSVPDLDWPHGGVTGSGFPIKSQETNQCG